MQIYKIKPLGFASNCYLVTEDGKTAVAVDPAQPRVLKRAQELGLAVKYVLLTHGHFDHICGCAALQKAGAKVGCLEAEKGLALHCNLGMELGFGTRVPCFEVDFTFADEDTLEFCGMSVKIIATPGHTAGSCCYLIGGALFTGDTLFLNDHGRTDLPTGSEAQMKDSLKRLAALAGDYPVYSGHGQNTTLEEERKWMLSI